MQTLNLARFILALSGLTVVTGQEARFPDFSCHEEYDWEYPSEEGGEKLVQYMMTSCKTTDCFHKCALGDILDYNGGLNTEESITYWVSLNFKGHSQDTAKPFAARIIAECFDIAEETISVPCVERTKFYDCVDNAAGCKP